MADNFKPTLGSKPTTELGKKYTSNFNKTMSSIAPNVNLNEIDGMLSETDFGIKKKIFSLPKMEALVFSDPKLSAKYEEMASEGESKFGYHYNETIQNILFNDYVLNSAKYLQKYKQAIPKEKKRRDASGINQLKKAGEETMQTRNVEPKASKPLTEEGADSTKVMFLVNETDPENHDVFAYFPEEKHDVNGEYNVGYSHVGQHSAVHPAYAAESRPATPEEYQDLKAELEGVGYNLEVIEGMNEMTGTGGGAGGAFSGSGQYTAPLGYKKPVDETTGTGGGGSGAYVGPAVWGGGDLMKTRGKANVKKVPMVKGGTFIQESTNYLVDPSGFEKFIDMLNEDCSNDSTKDMYNQVANDYESTHPKSNDGMGVSAKPQSPQRQAIEKGIGDNTMFYVDQDVDLMRDDDVQILHNDMTHKNSYFPHQENPSLPSDGIVRNTKKPPEGHWDEITGDDRINKLNYISKNSDAYGNETDNMSNQDLDAIDSQIKTHKLDSPNLTTMEESKKIQEKAKSPAQQRLFGMAHAVQKGELSPSKVGGAVKKIAKDVSPKDVEDFASTKHSEMNETDKPVAMKGLPPQKQNSVNVSEDMQSMIGDSPDTMANKPAPVGTPSSNMDTGLRASGGVNESYETLLEEINNELKAFSIHQDKLKKMTEDRKPSALVLKDRLGDENKKNFKKDLQHSGTKEIIDVEKELQWKDQQTEIGKDPYKLGQDIEDKAIKTGDMKSGEALKNVGDSANEDGDEIPKRNLTQEEQDEVNLYRKGLGDLVYDNEPGERFEERMKADMGDKLYKQRQDKQKFEAGRPMYNKDTQPTEAGIKKQQFDKEKSGWNEREGLKESIITGKYFNNLGKKVIVEFNLNEVQELTTPSGTARQTGLFEVNLEGLGNTYTQKVSVNESAVKAMDKFKFFTDGDKIFAMKNPVQNLSEAAKNEKPVVNEQFNKMKHLLNYKPDTYMNTDNTKKNRGF